MRFPDLFCERYPLTYKYLVERYFKRGSVAVLMVFTAVIGALALPFV
jgi:hypothetical protein